MTIINNPYEGVDDHPLIVAHNPECWKPCPCDFLFLQFVESIPCCATDVRQRSWEWTVVWRDCRILSELLMTEVHLIWSQVLSKMIIMGIYKIQVLFFFEISIYREMLQLSIWQKNIFLIRIPCNPHGHLLVVILCGSWEHCIGCLKHASKIVQKGRNV